MAEPGAPEHPNVARVRAYAAERGVDLRVRRFPAGTRTAEDAARAIGVQVGQIVKSLVFRAGAETLVVLCSGAARVAEAKLAVAAGAGMVRRATADEAKEATGYAIGGVPPFGHTNACRILCDRGLLPFDEVWAACGLPDAVFAITPADLVRLSGASVVDVA
jgi:prolyl-tRNA editing enzyme YbaK/EbsC (Cys-tRNA(Pro) deacylase)